MVAEGDRVTKETDDKGRVYLGTDLANTEVTVEVVEVEPELSAEVEEFLREWYAETENEAIREKIEATIDVEEGSA